MTLLDTKPQQREFHERVVREILRGGTAGAVQPLRDRTTARKLATLERQAPTIVRRARDAGADIEYLGVAPLFAETRLYGGVGTDWVLAPVTDKDGAVVPRKERLTLERLARAHIDFPLMFIAHEVTREATANLPALPPGDHMVIEASVGKALVGPVPEPQASLRLADRLNRRSHQALAAAARTGRVVGTAAAIAAVAPVALVGGALASLATLDPIILGAVPALSPREEEPAAWFVLARWDW